MLKTRKMLIDIDSEPILLNLFLGFNALMPLLLKHCGHPLPNNWKGQIGYINVLQPE